MLIHHLATCSFFTFFSCNMAYSPPLHLATYSFIISQHDHSSPLFLATWLIHHLFILQHAHSSPRNLLILHLFFLQHGLFTTSSSCSMLIHHFATCSFITSLFFTFITIRPLMFCHTKIHHFYYLGQIKSPPCFLTF